MKRSLMFSAVMNDPLIQEEIIHNSTHYLYAIRSLKPTHTNLSNTSIIFYISTFPTSLNLYQFTDALNNQDRNSLVQILAKRPGTTAALARFCETNLDDENIKKLTTQLREDVYQKNLLTCLPNNLNKQQRSALLSGSKQWDKLAWKMYTANQLKLESPISPIHLDLMVSYLVGEHKGAAVFKSEALRSNAQLGVYLLSKHPGLINEIQFGDAVRLPKITLLKILESNKSLSNKQREILTSLTNNSLNDKDIVTINSFLISDAYNNEKK